MNPLPKWKTRAPVVAFGLCIVIGWIASYVFGDWLLPLVGMVAGLAVGDLVEAILRPPEPPARKRIGKPR